ncbi:MAG: hypothetical protein ACLR2E_18650 [Lachnospiraceae bacterium]
MTLKNESGYVVKRPLSAQQRKRPRPQRMRPKRRAKASLQDLP